MRPCNSCPFRKDTKNFGSGEWLIDVIRGLKRERFDHTCHKTDPKADGYVGHKHGKESVCMGVVAMVKKEKNQCYDSRIAVALVDGSFDWKNLETDSVFDTTKDFIERHLAPIKAAGDLE